VVAAVDTVAPARTIVADGGASRNSTLMQIQADISGREVHRALDRDLSALGAAHLAGRTAGVWTGEQLDDLPRHREQFQPYSSESDRIRMRSAWQSAVDRARGLPVASRDRNQHADTAGGNDSPDDSRQQG
jgi:glycerol kinase